MAISGGKDSLALASYMAKYQALAGWQLSACYVNHHLRGEESFRDEQFCMDWCTQNNIPFSAVSVNVAVQGRGVEDAARRVRYDALVNEAKRLNCTYIVTAHTTDDRLEGFFVDLLTGASMYTLGSVAETRQISVDVTLVRPFLNITSNMISEYLVAEGLTPVFDSTNNNTGYTRNMVRLNLLPALRQSLGEARYEHLQTMIRRLQQNSAHANALMADIIGNTVGLLSYPAEGGLVVDREMFCGLPSELQTYLLGSELSRLVRVDRRHIMAILEQLGHTRSNRISLPDGYVCEITPRNIRLFHISLVAPFSIACSGAGLFTIDDQRKVILGRRLANGGDIVVRSRRDGDKLGANKLKTLFERKHLDIYERDRAILVESAGTLVWVQYISVANNDVEVISDEC
ncbi:hypothetical protein AGMMS49941_06500 [Deferribacterales bacterium]|nr:hypothetical protein AGMMS49941_06500 [Deferribacterales bacterium]